ncbi:MAG: ArnT family glycosyltransferase [Patescibacteria group bacterium]
MIKKVKHLREKIALLFLFTTSFLISFFKGTDIHISEDLGSSIAAFKFAEYPSITPLMSNQLNAMQLFALPFYFFFGFHFSSLRIAQAFFLGLAVIIFYLFIKRITKDKKIAFLSSLFLAFYPYFILMKFSEYPFTGFLAILILFLFSLIRNKDGKIYLIILGLVSGFSFYYKVLLGAYAFCLLLGFLIFEWSKAREKLWNFKSFPFFLVSVIIGALPWILWNVFAYPWESVKYFISGAETTSVNLVPIIATRVHHFVEIFVHSPEKYYGEITWIGGLIFISFILSTSYLLFTRRKEYLIYPFTLFTYILLSTIHLNGLIPKHLYVIIPLIVATIGFAFHHLKNNLSKSKEKFILIIFAVLVALSFYNTKEILFTPNNYNFYQTDHDIGYALRGKDFDKIYLFEPGNNGFWDSLIFTSQHRGNVFLASEVFRGGDEVFKGHWNGGAVGDFEEAKLLSLSLEDILDEAEGNKNVYIDAFLFADDSKRKKSKKYFDSMVTEKGYKKIEMERDLKRLQYEEELKRTYNIWVPKEEEELIEELEAIKQEI